MTLQHAQRMLKEFLSDLEAFFSGCPHVLQSRASGQLSPGPLSEAGKRI